jgi:F-type H+-transporting ATPase subunit b
MRRQRLRLLFFGAVALVLLFGFARPASAQEDPATSEDTTGETTTPPPVADETPDAVTQTPVATDPVVAGGPAETPAADAPSVLVDSAVPAVTAQDEPTAQGQEGEDPTEAVVEEAKENGATEADAECVETIHGGGSVEDCQEAPNPLLPEVNEIIWGIVGFSVVFFFLAKFGLPQIKGTMNARTEKIRTDLQTAESQREEADSLLAEYRAQLNDARSEAGQIIEEARQASDQIKRDQEARLQTELAELRERAVNDIEAAKTQAMADLRTEVAQLAIGAAETIVGRNLDAATQTQLVDEYIDQISARRS